MEKFNRERTKYIHKFGARDKNFIYLYGPKSISSLLVIYFLILATTTLIHLEDRRTVNSEWYKTMLITAFEEIRKTIKTFTNFQLKDVRTPIFITSKKLY